MSYVAQTEITLSKLLIAKTIDLSQPITFFKKRIYVVMMSICRFVFVIQNGLKKAAIAVHA